jgi:hypothetical protein
MRSAATPYPFIIVLKNRHRKAVWLTGMLAGLVAAGLFAWRTRMPDGSGLNWIAAGAVLVLLGWSAWEISHKRTTRFMPALIVASIGFALIEPHSILAIPYLVLAWLEKQALAAQEIGFNEKEIVFNGLWPKKIQWSALTNVVLKDGVLTLDFKNNSIIQKDTDDLGDDEYDGEEDEFNTFCRTQLQLHNGPGK